MTSSVTSLRILAAAVAAVLLTQTGAARADTRWKWEKAPRVVEDRFRVELGWLKAGLDTSARIDNGLDFPGTEFDAEDDFGLSDSKFMLMPELTLLPGKNHLVRLNGFSLLREGHRVIDRDIDYDFYSFESGDLIDSTLNLKAVGVTYGYRFLRFERFDATGLLGVLVGDFTNNAEIRGQTMREPSGEVAPIPLVGLEARLGITKSLSLEARGQYMSATIEDISGKITDFRLAATWRLNAHLVAGLGYSSLSINAESENEDSAGFADLKMAGPLLFLRASL